LNNLSLDWSNLWIWSFLILFIGALLYTAISIKKEKKNFLKRTITYKLKGFNIPIAPWWTLIESDENHLNFKRTDTRYDWVGLFSIIPYQNTPIEKQLVEIIHNRKILFDEETSDIPNREKISKDFRIGKIPHCDFTRVEGTATKEEVQRLYLDMALIKDNKRKLLLLCESRSSVLNGLIEGPYFEETLKQITVSNIT
jgi:hypothetical protein